jgi:hypothetical protein
VHLKDAAIGLRGYGGSMRINKFSTVVGMVAILAVLLVFASCGGKEKEAAVKTEDTPLNIESKGSKIDLAGTAEWPADMFAGVPKFTFGKIERASKGEEGGMMKFNIYYRDMEKGGIEKYMELLKEAGWKTDINAAGGAGGYVSGEKEGFGLQFMFNAEDKTGMLAVYTIKND